MHSTKYYNNLVSKDEWIKVDPKDARIMALTTELEQLKKGTAGIDKPKGNGNGNGNGNGTDPNKYFGVDKWRTENKGATIVRDGVTYHWCPKHKHPAGAYNGLYYRDHDEAGHDEWKKTRRWNKKSGSDGSNGAAAPTPGGPAKKLTIASELKTAFATDFCISEADIDKVLAKVNGQGN